MHTLYGTNRSAVNGLRMTALILWYTSEKQMFLNVD